MTEEVGFSVVEWTDDGGELSDDFATEAPARVNFLMRCRTAQDWTECVRLLRVVRQVDDEGDVVGVPEPQVVALWRPGEPLPI
jgi:hypothetical protein